MNKVIQFLKGDVQDNNGNMEGKIDNRISDVQSGTVQYVIVGAETVLPSFFGKIRLFMGRNLFELHTHFQI